MLCVTWLAYSAEIEVDTSTEPLACAQDGPNVKPAPTVAEMPALNVELSVYELDVSKPAF